MEYLSKNAIIDLIFKNGIGYYRDGYFEVKSFWKNYCEAVEEKEEARHFCNLENKEIIIKLFPFETLNGKFWKIGGCKYCKKLIYFSKTVDL